MIDAAATRRNQKTTPAQIDTRLPAIDRLRGLVILLMALDHVRDFFNLEAMQFDPLDLSRTYPALFLTRFITHICAPTFVLLAGVSAYLHGKKLSEHRALASFLVTRGAWLILLDALVISPVWRVEFGPVYLGTLWAIGVSMIALAALVWLPPRAVLAAGGLIVVSHNLLDGLHAQAFGAWAPLWSMLHEPGALPFGLRGALYYPVLPWIGIMALGYGMGEVFLGPAGLRRRQLTLLGLAAIALFLLLRGTNFYGDPHPWSVQASGVTTALSVLKVTKYPPSLLYALVTLGPALLLLSAMDRLGGKLGEVLATFGRVPLFIYVLHLYAALAAAIALWLAEGFDMQQLQGLRDHAAPPAWRLRPSGKRMTLRGWASAFLAPMPPGFLSWPRSIRSAGGLPASSGGGAIGGSAICNCCVPGQTIVSCAGPLPRLEINEVDQPRGVAR